MNWKVAVFVGLPEQFFIFLSIILMLGFKDKTDIRKLKNFVLVCGGTLGMFVVTATLKMSAGLLQMPSDIAYIVNYLIQCSVFTLLFSNILKSKLYKVSISVFSYYLVFAVSEYLNYQIMNFLTGITIEQCISNTYYMIRHFLPLHIFQAIIAIILYKLPFGLLDLNESKRLSKNLKTRVLLANIATIAAFIIAICTVAFFVFRIKTQSIETIFVLWMNIMMLTVLALAQLASNHKFIKVVNMQIVDKIIQFSWFKREVNKVVNGESDLYKLRSKLEVIDYKGGESNE